MKLQFGSSGIRGKYPDTVNPEVAFELGRLLPEVLGKTIALGRDPRFSGPVLKAAFISSALQAGAHILDYDLVPTPALAYETHSQNASAGVEITASHNPPEYNGFKIFNSSGGALKDEQDLRGKRNRQSETRQRVPFAGKVETRQPHAYMDMLSQLGFKREWKVVLDPGNGAACGLSATIYRELLGKVTAINSNPDGGFPARGSEPTDRSTRMLARVVVETGSHAGIAFDGDGDRMFVVDEKGTSHLQDRVLGAYISFLAKKSKGPFLVPLDASMAIDEMAEKHGARLVRGPVGDALLLEEMKRWKAKFAGEPSGAWIHHGLNSCPDGILSGLLFLKSVEETGGAVSKVVESIPHYHMMRQSMRHSGRLTRAKIASLASGLRKIVGKGSSVSARFGLRVSSDRSWVLVRESGTEPVVRVTGESKDPSEGKRIMKETLQLLRQVLKSRA